MYRSDVWPTDSLLQVLETLEVGRHLFSRVRAWRASILASGQAARGSGRAWRSLRIPTAPVSSFTCAGQGSAFRPGWDRAVRCTEWSGWLCVTATGRTTR